MCALLLIYFLFCVFPFRFLCFFAAKYVAHTLCLKSHGNQMPVYLSLSLSRSILVFFYKWSIMQCRESDHIRIKVRSRQYVCVCVSIYVLQFYYIAVMIFSLLSSSSASVLFIDFRIFCWNLEKHSILNYFEKSRHHTKNEQEDEQAEKIF